MSLDEIDCAIVFGVRRLDAALDVWLHAPPSASR